MSQKTNTSAKKRTLLVDINAHLKCILCSGYLVDATTINECLHSFCRSCIVEHLDSNKCCPLCDVEISKTNPLSKLRSDKILQDIVYKLIPDVFNAEMKRRRDFYANKLEAEKPCDAEDRGEVVEHRMFYMPNDKISLSLEYGYGDNQMPDNGYQPTNNANEPHEQSNETDSMKRYLLCPAGLTILHLKKFLVNKYTLPNTYKVDIMYLEDILSEEYTLMDVAYIYQWRRSDPMRLFYRISERPMKRLKTKHPQTIESKSGSDASLDNANTNLSNTNNKSNNSVTQSKLVGSQVGAASSTSNTNTLTTIMTGAATLPTQTTTTSQSLKRLNSHNISNNSGYATGVTSSKASIATPKNADTSNANVVHTSNAYRVTSSPTAATPQGIAKPTHVSVSAVHTDEPPKKLRKILPANNPTVATKTNPTTTQSQTLKPTKSPTPSTTSTSSSTVNTLRQCRIKSDKNKLLCTSVNSIACNATSDAGLSARKCSPKEESVSVSVTSVGSEPCLTSVKKNYCRKSSAFDVRTLIGTKSPTLPCNRQSVESTISGNEFKDEKGINHKKSANSGKSGSAKQAAKGNLNASSVSSVSVRDLNGKSITKSSNVSSMCSMPSTMDSVQQSITTGLSGIKKPLSSASSVAISRPPTNREASPKSRADTPVTAPTVAAQRPFVPIKITKNGTFVSPKQLNAKSLKCSQNDQSVNSCNKSKDLTTDRSNNKISNKPITSSRTASQPQLNEPQFQSSPLSPTSIKIKLPTNPTKCSNAVTNKIMTSTSFSHMKQTNNSSKEQTNVSAQQIKQTDSLRQTGLDKSIKDTNSAHLDANVTVSHNCKKPLMDSKSAPLNQHKSVQHISNQSHSKSPISQSSVTKPKGASINQIVNKIASGAVSKTTSVNVTSTTPTLELTKSTAMSALSLTSSKATANEVNDDKVSTTTNESGVSSSMLKNPEDSAMKAVSSATTNTGNLVIRISTKSHTVDREKSSSHKVNKFEIKRDIHSSHSTKPNANTCDGNSAKTNTVPHTQTLVNGKNDKRDAFHKALDSYKSSIDRTQDNGDEDYDDEDDTIGGPKLVVDVPNEDSCGDNEVGTSKVTFETDDIDSGRGSDIIRLSCDDVSMGSPQSSSLSIKTPESINVSSDMSTKLALNITSTTTLSASSAVLASPPPTPTPSPKSESDPSVTIDSKSKTGCSTAPNGPLDLSMSSTSKKDSNHEKIATPPISMRAIYDIPQSKPKHCVNPAVLDKHRGLFPPSNAPNKQHPSFKIVPTQAIQHPNRHPQHQTQPQTNLVTSKKDRSVNTHVMATNTSTGNAGLHNSLTGHSRNRSPHHHHHHNHKNYSVITPDPHRYTPKLVIRNIGSPPSITSHFNYQSHH